MTGKNKRELSILTFNIRRDRGDDGINNWEFRRGLVAGILERHSPDIAVFQEVLAHQLHDLESMLPGYKWTGVGRDDGFEAGEFAPVFFRGLADARSGTFWFSDTPETHSRTWPGMIRICTWVDFAGAQPFALFNTHLEYKFESTQMKSIELIRQRTAAYPADHPILLTGDFNFYPGTPPYVSLARIFKDSHVAGDTELGGVGEDTSTTSHGFTGKTVVSPRGGRIDYIWYRGNVEVTDYSIVTDGSDNASGVFPSDHWPVTCRILIP